jgi:uncharacterized membrane protein
MLNVNTINFGCHGIPERCFHFKGKSMPFCSRCLGCGIGHILSFLFFITGSLPSFLFALMLIIPLAIDWSIQEFLGVVSNNYRRLATGIMGGFGVGIVIWKLFGILLSRF